MDIVYGWQNTICRYQNREGSKTSTLNYDMIVGYDITDSDAK